MSELFRATYRQAEADLSIGRRLPELYRDAGLVDVGVTVHADHYTHRAALHTALPDLVRSLRPKTAEGELADDSELDRLDRTVRAHLESPGTLTIPHLFFTVWGRKPHRRSDGQPQ
jgi:hypothetical protein